MIPRRKIDIQKKDFFIVLKYFLDNKNNFELVSEFLNRLRLIYDTKNLSLTSSGREAMLKALEMASISKGDIIGVPAYTLGELIPLLQKNGYKPVPIDVSLEDYNILSSSLLKRIEENNIKALVCLHSFGVPCDIIKIRDICNLNKIVLIEDCAHCIGAEVNNKMVGTFGDFSFFSFESNKPLQSFGGGMIISKKSNSFFENEAEKNKSNDQENILPVLKKIVKNMCEELLVRSPFYSILAKILFNPNISGLFEKFYRSSYSSSRGKIDFYTSLQAEIALERLSFLKIKNSIVYEKIEYYKELLPDDFIPQKLINVSNCTPVPYNMAVRFLKGNIQTLRQKALKHGLDIGIFGEVMDDCSRLLEYKDCPNSSILFNQVILLPFHQHMSRAEIRRCCAILKLINQ